MAVVSCCRSFEELPRVPRFFSSDGLVTIAAVAVCASLSEHQAFDAATCPRGRACRQACSVVDLLCGRLSSRTRRFHVLGETVKGSSRPSEVIDHHDSSGAGFGYRALLRRQRGNTVADNSD